MKGEDEDEDAVADAGAAVVAAAEEEEVVLSLGVVGNLHEPVVDIGQYWP